MEKYTNASAATWARTICLIVALLNSLLAAFNKSPLPIDNEQLQQLVSTLITVVVRPSAHLLRQEQPQIHR